MAQLNIPEYDNGPYLNPKDHPAERQPIESAKICCYCLEPFTPERPEYMESEAHEECII